MRSQKIEIIVSIILVIIISVGSAFWVLHLNDAINNYRSPLSENPPLPGESTGERLSRRVVFVIIDGLRVDMAGDSALMPVLASLRQAGASATVHSQTPTFSTPSYGVLLTGAWPYLSDAPAMNLDYEVIPTLTQDNIFSAASRQGLKTASSGYYWFEKLIPAQDLDAGFFTPGEDEAADLDVMAAALSWLDDPEYALVLIHIDQLDHISHVDGALSSETEQAARNADAYLGEILAKLDLSQDTILICSDHGHIDQGGHGGPESIVTQEPLVMAGAGIKSGKYRDMNQVDIAPTIAALLGSNVPASTQGQVLTEMMLLTGSQLRSIVDAEKTQQTFLADAIDASLDVTVARNGDGSPQPGAIEEAIRARLVMEQLPRLLTVIAIMIAVVALIVRFNQQPVLPILGSAAVFLVIFNGIYALILGNHYSFSSIRGIIPLVVSYALIALVSEVIALTVLRFWSKTSPRRSMAFSQVTLTFVLILQLLLFLPGMVYYVLVGKTITWTLPHITTQFWSLHGLLQTALAGIVGLLLLGLALLWGRLTKPAVNKGITGE